jgi:excisionase family DNA binding protein
MKIEFEQTDLQRIAEMVAERLLPMLKPSKAQSKGRVDDSFMDLPQLCTYLSMSERWVRDKVSQKAIPYYRVGGILRFSVNEIDGYLRASKGN